MALAPGARLGPYEILSALGAGGMGEVYRARDTRLGREVAIKVIPEEFFEDKDRKERFEREARTLASLNHPGIAAIHSFEEISGRHLLVMELLEGESLRDRLEEGALPPRKAIELAVQIANGLAAAHEKGIVHRDLKPENVFVTREGRAKILDFGLAKLTHPERAADLTSAPTTPAATDTGAVMGTTGYMSPEQVRGEKVDARSDIFAFGAVLYEMLSGKRAFHEDTTVETLHAILKDDPQEISGSQTNVSPALERIVRRCLEKSADERFQSSRDVGFALEALSDFSQARAGPAPTGTTGWRFRPVGALLIALGFILVGALGVGVGRSLSKRPLPSFHRLTFQRGNIESARFAPDGQTIVYSAAWNESPVEIFSTRAEAAEWRSLGLPPARVESISRSGQIAIRYVSGTQRTGTLAQVPLGGGAPREIVERVRKADWAPDGGSLAIVRDVDGRDLLEFPVGTVLYETKPSGWISDLRVSPGGDLVAFFDHLERFDDRGSVVIVDRKRNRRILSDSWSGLQGLAWRPDNQEVWFSGLPPSGTWAIHAVTLSRKVRLVEQIAGNLRLLDVSSRGDVLVSQFTHRKSMKMLVRGETEERDLSWLDGSGAIDLSDDGKVLLFDEGLEGSRSRTSAVYFRKTDRSPAVRLGEGTPQALSPDGKWALVTLQYPEPAQLILLPTGAGESRTVPGASIHHERAVWFPDGKRILFSGNEPGKEGRLYVQDPFGGSPKAVTAEGVGLSWLPRPISPDGKWVAALSPGLKLHPIEGGEPRPVPGRGPGEIPSRWSADGRWLYLAHHNEMPRKIFRVDVSTGLRELVRELMPVDRVGVDLIFPVLLTPDGQTIVYSYSRRLSDLYLVTGLK